MSIVALLAPLACLVVVILLLFGVFFSPARVKSRQVSRIARQHFQNSRGTAHLRLMREAESRLQAELRAGEGNLAKLTADLVTLDQAQDRELTETLERYLVRAKLTEAHGVGDALRDRILADVFESHLTDLYHANEMPGIGEARQQAINAWVQRYSALLPSLCQSDFPGKAAVVARFADRRTALQEQTAQVTRRQDEIREQLDTLKQAMATFSGITERDFRAALMGQKANSAPLDTFNHGVFAEWEPMPDWFRCIVLEEAA